ncbi:MAG: MlaD family protein [Candidatus Theseobacter exili]|nr:MlaD family protein [Candidatus Theseobacter exili]
MEYFKAGIRSALMVMIAMIALVVLIVIIGGGNMFEKRDSLRILFPSIGDLDIESPVTFAGFEVGKVTEIRVLSQDEMKQYSGFNIEVVALIDANVKIHKDAVVNIKSLGFMGEKYIDFSPGSEAGGFVSESDLLKGNEPKDMNYLVEKMGGEMDVLCPKIQKIADDASRIVAEIKPIISEIKEKKQIQSILTSLQKAIDTFQDSLNALKAVIKENRDGIKNAVSNVEKAAVDVKGILEDNRPDIRKIVEDLKSIMSENRPDIRKIVEKVKDITQIVKEFVVEIKKNPWKLLHKPRSAKRGSSSENDKRIRRR